MKKSNQQSGFALIATVSIMVLIILIAMAMLSLTTIELRSSQNGRAMVEAQANARLALMLAIGELQKHTGSDTRITAPLNVMDTNAPPLTGVWKSWEGRNHDSIGRPIVPDYSSKTKSANSGDGRFVGYLVSGAAGLSDPKNDSLSDLVKTFATARTVPLLSDGTLGSNPGQVHLEPQLLIGKPGAMAWWVSPENQKARLIQPYDARTINAIDLVETGQSHSVPDPAVFGLAALSNDPEAYIPDPRDAKSASKSLSLRTTTLAPEAAASNPAESFHNLSISAVGLLTNTATGGWRKDLSLLTEKWGDIYNAYPGGKLPLFRFSPEKGETSQVPRPTIVDYGPEQSNLYPWSEYSTIIGTKKQPNTYWAASASWESLVSFATSYKNFSYSSGGVTSPFAWDRIVKAAANLGDEQIFNYKHQQRLYPQIARFQFIVYAKAVDHPIHAARYSLLLRYVPCFTLWNPNNVTLEHTISGTSPSDFLGFGWKRTLPAVMAIERQSSYPTSDSVPGSRYKLFSRGNLQVLDSPGNNFSLPYDLQLPENVTKGYTNFRDDIRDIGFWLPEGVITFKPGEVKIFPPVLRDSKYPWGMVARLEEGYNAENVVGIERIAEGYRTMKASHRLWFLMKSDRLTKPYRYRNAGTGFSLSFGQGRSHFGGGSMPTGTEDEFHNLTALSTESQGSAYWPPDEVDEISYSIGELASADWIPLFSISFGPRLTIGTGPGTQQNRPTKGVVQNNALASMVLSEPGSGDAKDHPVNNPFDFAYHSLRIGSTITPNLSNSEGYIATGYQSGDGLSRLIMVEVPLRPMSSLIELQGWNPRGNNPYPPFQMNLIGNSDATPLIPKNSVVPTQLKPNGVDINLQHDDAYCANHLLFDDWFLSSIAPQPSNLGGNIAKDLKTFYKDFLTGQEKLSNRSYHAITEDSGLRARLAADRVDEVIDSPKAFLEIASRLEVGGMFNVNSTSVAAWKALLGHAKNREEIAYHGANGIESTTGANPHVVSRGAVATDYEAGSGKSHSGKAPNTSEFTGFRSLTDEQIGDLAEKIVEQVRLRGPFLSLSEFVNRRLSSNDDLALAGAVQTAINNLQTDPMKELRDPANKLSDNTMPAADPKLDGVSYEYAKAAEGSSAYGAPGWIRQADVLRPIAPILSARDDTFTIRAYGDARDSAGNIVARAWCEATVQRTRDFIDTTDQADSIEPPASKVNQTFGRKYVIKSFRWLNRDEV